MHERLLGPDYPFFLNDGDEFVTRVQEILEDSEEYPHAVRAAREAASRHTFKSVAVSLQTVIDRFYPDPTVWLKDRRKVLFVGHDLKFMTGLLEYFSALPTVEVRVERWSGVNEHDEKVSRENVAWADAIFVEWCAGAALWFSRNRRPGQRLVCRFHSFERKIEFPKMLEQGSMDHIAFVAPHWLRQMKGQIEIDEDRLSVLPNGIPKARLQRPKLPGAEFNLGMVGISPSMKRFDLAVETLRLLRVEDERFTLYVKGELPTAYGWIWGNAGQREYYNLLTAKIAGDPSLRESIVFDSFGAVEEWFRKIGFILSMSDWEGTHVALEEGIATGAIPIIRTWEGAREVYWDEPDDNFISSPEEAATAVLRWIRGGSMERRQQAALDALADDPMLRVCQSWEGLLLGPDPVRAESPPQGRAGSVA
jgi:glycosyltransferase involved in cell wall biosynthesis